MKRKELTAEQKAILKKWGLPEDLKEPVSVQIEVGENEGGFSKLRREKAKEKREKEKASK